MVWRQDGNQARLDGGLDRISSYRQLGRGDNSHEGHFTAGRNRSALFNARKGHLLLVGCPSLVVPGAG